MGVRILLSKQFSHDQQKIYLLASFIMTQCLFFIDEGYYDFRWMLSFGNWVAFVIYFLVLYLAQVTLSILLFWIKPDNLNKAVIVVAGLVLGIAFCFWWLSN